MKRLICCSVLALVMAACASAQRPGGGFGGPGGQMSEAGVKMRVQRMAQQLKLTPQQTSKLMSIELHNMREMQRIRKERDEAVKKVLTPAQYAQLEQIRSHMRRAFGPGGPGGGGPRG